MEKGQGYQAIAEELREQIRSGRYAPGVFLPTEKELQSSFGVSRSTIRRALAALADSGWADVHPKRGVAACLGPNQELAGSVAFIDHADLINERVFFGISRALHGTGLHLSHVDSRVYGVEGAIEYAAEIGCAAAYIWSKTGFPDVARVERARQKMPIIALSHRLGAVQTDLITEDNLNDAAAIVRHLAQQGRRRIGVSGMMDMLEVNHDRFSGYLKGLFDSDLMPHPVDFLFCVTSGGGPEETSLLTRRLMDVDRPDALFVLQDMCVPAVVEAIFEAGLRVPEDVAVVAFGGEAPLQIDDVGLTSMVVDWPLFASECVRVLLERLRRPNQPYSRVAVSTTLVVRGSCGAPYDPAHDPQLSPDLGIHLGGRWRMQQEYLRIRSDTPRRSAALPK
ncbi:MAG: GntR family transcriptional regulator [Fimbriimonas sp.]|nr:GntR family transcriptional regulator [Fimbriimonas sp.]